jgi:iron complex transport system ATP-binding protein
MITETSAASPAPKPALRPAGQAAQPARSRLAAEKLVLAYNRSVVVDDLTLELPVGGFTVIIGPNACGKSTLLKALARTLVPASGAVLLDDVPIRSLPSQVVARRLAMLPQSPIAPDAITVRDLVGRGRYAHQSLFRHWSVTDEVAVEQALAATGTTELADRFVSELSGGQRQRVWIALVLAQQTELLLLDEPTTFLDIAHQYEVLDLCARLHREGRTVAVVLHDLNQAARYASHLVVMKDGLIVAEGEPSQILTAKLVEQVFGLPCVIITDPESGTPLVIARRGGQDARFSDAGTRPFPDQPRSQNGFSTDCGRR